MGGIGRILHPNWFCRYIFGGVATVQIASFLSEQQYCIPRQQDGGNSKWTWWNDFQAKKRAGLIDASMPGYVYAKYRNEAEKGWEENLIEERGGKGWEGYGSAAE